MIEWPQEISENILNDVLVYKNHLLELDIESLVQINNAYNSLLVIYSVTIDNINSRFLELKQYYKSRNILKKRESKLFKIPVCYDEHFGLDLVEISEEKNRSIKDIVELHYSTIYTVILLDFYPVFYTWEDWMSAYIFRGKIVRDTRLKKERLQLEGRKRECIQMQVLEVGT